MKRFLIFCVTCAGILSLSSCATGTGNNSDKPNDPEPIEETAVPSTPAKTLPDSLPETEAITPQYWKERYDSVPLTNVSTTLTSVEVRKGDEFLGLHVEDLYFFQEYSGTPDDPVLNRTGVRVFFSGELTLTGNVTYVIDALEGETLIFAPDSKSLEKIPSFPPEFSDVFLISLTGADELCQTMQVELSLSPEEIESLWQAGEEVPQEEVLWENCTLTIRNYILNHVEDVGGMHTADLVKLKRHTENETVFTGSTNPDISSTQP